MDIRRRHYEGNKLAKRLRRLVGEAIADFDMIRAGDRVMVCLSGGKDSYALLDVLLSLKEHAPVDFEVIAFNLDQRHPGYPADVLPRYLTSLGVPFRIETQDTYSVVKRVIPEGKTMCSLCSRLRRGVIYRVAKEIGATKVALGHHRDDILETFFLNLFFAGKIKAMPPKLVSDDGNHIVIRPLAYAGEGDLIRYAQLRQFPIIPCDLCGSQDNLQRKQIKAMLAAWEKSPPRAHGDHLPEPAQCRAFPSGGRAAVRLRCPGPNRGPGARGRHRVRFRAAAADRDSAPARGRGLTSRNSQDQQDFSGFTGLTSAPGGVSQGLPLLRHSTQKACGLCC